MKMLESSIRTILMDEWDPIGVRGVAEAQDEYDDYLAAIAGLLREGADADRIASHLQLVESGMGLAADPRRARVVALKLLALSD